MTVNRKILNTPEPRDLLLARLHREAAAGVKCDASEAQALEFRRDQYGLTKTEFAVVLGIHLPHYSETIRGKRRLPVHAIERAMAIGVPVEPLIAGRGKEPRQ